jgi:hypothetical protein
VVVPHHNLANHNDARVLLQNYHALYFAHMQVLMTAAMNAQNNSPVAKPGLSVGPRNRVRMMFYD